MSNTQDSPFSTDDFQECLDEGMSAAEVYQQREQPRDQQVEIWSYKEQHEIVQSLLFRAHDLQSPEVAARINDALQDFLQAMRMFANRVETILQPLETQLGSSRPVSMTPDIQERLSRAMFVPSWSSTPSQLSDAWHGIQEARAPGKLVKPPKKIKKKSRLPSDQSLLLQATVLQVSPRELP